MKELLLGGLAGLALGIAAQRLHLHQREELRCAVGLLAPELLRALLLMLGAGTMLTALMMWLAVIDVDEIVVLPLSAGTLAGGVLFGVAVALAGFTPLSVFPGLFCNRYSVREMLEKDFCINSMAGMVLTDRLLPLLEKPLAALQDLPPHSQATLFSVTLDEPFLLGGGFLSQGCLGLLLAAIALCIPSNRLSARRLPPPSEGPAPSAVPRSVAPLPAPQLRLSAPPKLLRLPAPAAEAPIPPADASASEDAFVAALPGEEPLIVDTAMDDPEEDESPN